MTRANSLNRTRLTLTFTFHCPTATAYPLIAVSTSSPQSLFAQTTRIVNASVPVRGTYQIGLDGAWSAPLNWNDNWVAVKQRLQSLGITGVSLLQYNDPSDGFIFDIDVSSPVVRE